MTGRQQLTFDITTPEEFLDKLRAERDAVKHDLTSARHAINAAMTAHHLIEWVWALSVKRDRFGNFSTYGPFFNVQSKTLDMHIRQDEIGSVFAVEKPGHLDGVVTLSIQFYDRTGSSAFKVFLTFGNKAPSEECRQWWVDVRDEFAIHDDV